jgi:hypothetical protein
MRKIGTLLLLAAVGLSAVGCGGDITQPSPQGSPPTGNPSAPPPPPPLPPAPK